MSASTRRLLEEPVLRSLQLREGINLPAPWKHPTTFQQAALFLRGHVPRIACTRCQRGNGRFARCVHYPNSSDVWPTDFFHGACANCLPGSSTSCSLSESSPLQAAERVQGESESFHPAGASALHPEVLCPSRDLTCFRSQSVAFVLPSRKKLATKH